jgi:hypothetical protein
LIAGATIEIDWSKPSSWKAKKPTAKSSASLNSRPVI